MKTLTVSRQLGIFSGPNRSEQIHEWRFAYEPPWKWHLFIVAVCDAYHCCIFCWPSIRSISRKEDTHRNTNQEIIHRTKQVRISILLAIEILNLILIAGAIFDGTFLVIAAYISCEPWLAGLFFTLSVGAQGMYVASSIVVPMDLSPNFAGSIAAVTSGLSSTAGFIVPAVVGFLTPNVSKCRANGVERKCYNNTGFSLLHSRIVRNGVSSSGWLWACISWRSLVSRYSALPKSNHGMYYLQKRTIIRTPMRVAQIFNQRRITTESLMVHHSIHKLTLRCFCT